MRDSAWVPQARAAERSARRAEELHVLIHAFG